jgi:hypothetical protein
MELNLVPVLDHRPDRFRKAQHALADHEKGRADLKTLELSTHAGSPDPVRTVIESKAHRP